MRAAPRLGRTARQGLVRAALAARRRAYAPYSRFQVGAAVRAGSRIFHGANVENASYGLTLCAERIAITAAIVAGARRLDAIAVASATSPPTPPCGMCLQTMAEFARADLPVLLANLDGEIVEMTLGELLPRGFSNKYL
ncbi:MAG TPA: cytidine deaminase [Anaeromyxobacteraceae bacterium]|nr:cytidine deaminase [Anaeromyxobacteraceae bacterium]